MPNVVDGDESKSKVYGGEQGRGDERKKGDDAVKGVCVSSDTPELFTFTSGEVKAPSRSLKLVGIFLFCQGRRRDIK